MLTGLGHLSSNAFLACNTELLVLSTLNLFIIRSYFVCQSIYYFLPVQELESSISDIVEEILTIHDTTKVCPFPPPHNLLNCNFNLHSNVSSVPAFSVSCHTAGAPYTRGLSDMECEKCPGRRVSQPALSGITDFCI